MPSLHVAWGSGWSSSYHWAGIFSAFSGHLVCEDCDSLAPLQALASLQVPGVVR